MNTRHALGFVVYLAVSAAAAGECGSALQPLMLDPEPDASTLAEIRAICMREAESGDADARYRLAFFHLGLNDWDPDQAVTLIRRSAVSGIAEAQYWLAWQYEAGPLLPNEPGSALYWYESSARSEHPLALRRLADAYEHGELGLAPDPERAVILRAEAARCER